MEHKCDKVQASFPCRACVALETSMTSLDDDDSLQGEEEPSLKDKSSSPSSDKRTHVTAAT